MRLELTAGRLFGLAGPLQKAPQPEQRSARGGPGRASQQQGTRGPVAQRPRHLRTPAPRFMSSWRVEEMIGQSPAHSCGSGECVPGSGARGVQASSIRSLQILRSSRASQSSLQKGATPSVLGGSNSLGKWGPSSCLFATQSPQERQARAPSVPAGRTSSS